MGLSQLVTPPRSVGARGIEMTKWYFNVRQNELLIEVEIRPTEDQASGFVSARKLVILDEATVRINFYPPEEMSLGRAYRLVEWLQVATSLAGQLDHYVKTPEDFKLRYEAVQYNPEVWQSCYVYPVKEESAKPLE